MKKRTGNTFVKALLFFTVIAILMFVAIKFAGKPTAKIIIGQGENAKNYIDKANEAKNSIDRATKAAEDAMKKDREEVQ